MKRNLVVVGASAGGVEALRTLMSGMPADFDAAVLVVLHLPAGSRTALPYILDRAGPLRVRQAAEGDRLQAGQVLVAPPDQHLLVVDGKVTLSSGPRENGHRPAVDALFRSAARSHGRRVVAVVLSGAMDDGTAGMVAVHSRGGVGVVQDPSDALHPSMPRCAIQGASPEHVVAVQKIPGLLAALLREDLPDGDVAPVPPLLEAETDIVTNAGLSANGNAGLGEPSGFSCPDCNGSLFVLEDGPLRRFRCRVGHAWSPEGLLVQQSSALESALWTALRSLEEKAALTLDLTGRAAERGHALSASAFERQRQDAQHAALLVRDLLERVATGLVDLQGVDPPGDSADRGGHGRPLSGEREERPGP